MKSKSASTAAATASSLADLHQLQQQHHHQQQQLFNSALANSSQLTNSFGPNSGNGQLSAQLLNYAAQLSGGVKGLDSSASNWDPAVALQMSTALFGASASPAASSNADTLAQLNQLIAASLLQQQHQQNNLQESHCEPTRKSSSKQTHSPTSTSASATPIVCSICGQSSRDQSDYEAHLLTHISQLAHLSGSQQTGSSQANAYQYGLNLLRMQNLFSPTAHQASLAGSTVSNGASSNNSNNGTTNSTTTTSSNSSTTSSTNPPTIFNKKRKLLAASQASTTESVDFNSEAASQSAAEIQKKGNLLDLESLSLSRLGLETLLKGSASADFPAVTSAVDGNAILQQQAQSLLAQLAAAQATKTGGTANISSLANSSATTTSTTSTSNSTSSSALSTAFPCTSCHKTFATEVDLKAHLIRHLTQHPFVCVSCGKGFKYEHSLNFHIKSYHSGGGGNGQSNGNSTAASGSLAGGKQNANSTEKLALGKCKEQGTTGELKLKRSRNNAAKETANAASHNSSEIQTSGKEESEQTETELVDSANTSSTAISKAQQNLLSIATSSCTTTTPTSTSSSLLHSRLTLMDENHNASGHVLSSFGSGAHSTLLPLKLEQNLNSNLGYPSTFGKPPTNLPTDSPISIRSERLLVSVLEAVNVATDTPITLYKCCLCCVAFASLDQMAIHVANVHPPGSANQTSNTSGQHPIDLSLLLSGSGALFGGALNKENNASSAISPSQNGTNSGNSFSCDKCTAKFSIGVEFEMHMQLHRSLEAQAVAVALQNGNGSSNAAALQALTQQYPFNLLSHLAGGQQYTGANSVSGGQQTNATAAPATVDFRQILANASKDTDFGRKFAAQLLHSSQDSSTTDHHHHHPHLGLSPNEHLLLPYGAASHHHQQNQHRAGKTAFDAALGSFVDRCCSSSSVAASSPSSLPASAKMSNGGQHDPNNNSLLYLSLLPDGGAAKASAANSPSNRFSKAGAPSSIDSAILNLSSGRHQHHHNTEKGHASSGLATREKTPKKGSKSTAAAPADSTKGGGFSSGSSSNGSAAASASSLRHIKEPVDIFEGAGQSLPIQKFPLGDIEETAPGQFKCRFCEKTFDRVFSVHRHERVHTGFKPCICKTCGRGFSEKRNLRHHIIRFHSDGSGRELLKRKRKPKNGSLSPLEAATAAGVGIGGMPGSLSPDADSAASILRNQESFMSTLLARSAGAGGGGVVPEALFSAFTRASQQQTHCPTSMATLNGEGGVHSSLSNLKLNLAEMDRLKMSGNFSSLDADPMNLSGNGGNGTFTSNVINTSKNRRKGSKPSKKVYDEEEEDDDDDDDGHLVGEKMTVDVVPMMVTEGEDDDEEEDGDEEEEMEDVDEEDENEPSAGDKHSPVETANQETSNVNSEVNKGNISDGEETEAEEEEVDAEAELNDQTSQEKSIAAAEEVKEDVNNESSPTKDVLMSEEEDEDKEEEVTPPTLPPKKVTAKGRSNRRGVKRKSK